MITLAEAKLHLRVDHSEDEAAIADMIEAAVQHLASIGVDATQDPFPAPLKQAALMLISHFYAASVTIDAQIAPLPGSFYRLVAPYREIAL